MRERRDRERKFRGRKSSLSSLARITQPEEKESKVKNRKLYSSAAPSPFLCRLGIFIKNEGTPPQRSHERGGGCGSRFARAVVSFVVAGGVGGVCRDCSNRSASFRFRFRSFFFVRLARLRSAFAVDVAARVVVPGRQASSEAEAKADADADAEAATAANDAAAADAAAANDASERWLRLADALPLSLPLGDPASFDVPSREF